MADGWSSPSVPDGRFRVAETKVNPDIDHEPARPSRPRAGRVGPLSPRPGGIAPPARTRQRRCARPRPAKHPAALRAGLHSTSRRRWPQWSMISSRRVKCPGRLPLHVGRPPTHDHHPRRCVLNQTGGKPPPPSPKSPPNRPETRHLEDHRATTNTKLPTPPANGPLHTPQTSS